MNDIEGEFTKYIIYILYDHSYYENEYNCWALTGPSHDAIFILMLENHPLHPIEAE